MLIESGEPIAPRRGPALELRGVRLELTNPMARLSRSRGRGKVFSCLGEFVWYLSGSADVEHVAHYIRRYTDEAEPDGTVHAAYGTRLFGEGQRLESLIQALADRTDSRQAVIQLLEPGDQSGYRHVPCTCTLQFLKREGTVDMVVFMRSNDAYLGLPHDVFAFTMLQEIAARSVGAELGTYVHMIGSLHLYDRDREKAAEFLDEGWSSVTAMPAMPPGDPRPALARLVKLEAEIRAGVPVDVSTFDDPYWADLTRLLAVHALARRNADPETIATLRREMHSRVYDVFLNDRFDILED
jgi:thymidylate synthase